MRSGGTDFISFFWLLLIVFVVALIARKARVPYAPALAVAGAAVGASRLLPQFHLDPRILFAVFLPPLLFEAAINIPFQALKKSWKPIALFTFAGTALSTVIVAAIATRLLHLPFSVALVFGALISATDPIAVLAIFRRIRTDRVLSLIVEAESLFNDGIAAVLFAIAVGAVAGLVSGPLSISWELLRLIFGGVAVGAGLGMLASRIHYELDDHLVEITLTTIVAYASFLCADALHVSGVVAVVTGGLVIGNVGMPNHMSPGTRLAVLAFWEYASFAVNSIVFLLIGIEMAHVNWVEQAGLAAGAIVAVLAGRATVYPLSLLLKLFRSPIPRSWQQVLFWGGLRGALSMALALGLSRQFPHRDAVVVATFGAVIFSLLVQGTTVGLLLRRLGLSESIAPETRETREIKTEVMAVRAALLELERIRAADSHPNWSVELLMRDYRARLAELEGKMEKLSPGYRESQTQEYAEARTAALRAEKSAYTDAERQGWMNESDWREIAVRLDNELIGLSKQAER